MKILILTASAGNGHNSAGKRIAEKFKKEEPNCEIEMVDVYKNYSSKLSSWIIEKGYYFACNHLMWVYNYFFKKNERAKTENKDKSTANKQANAFTVGVIRKIQIFKPDLIICTHFFTAIALRNIKRVLNIPAKVVSMNLDYAITPFWQCASAGLDYMFVTNNEMIDPFKKLGYTSNQIKVSGIPISQEFYLKKDKQEVRAKLNLDKNKFTLLIMKASFFPVKERKLIKELQNINNSIQIIIINGNSLKSKSKLNKILSKVNTKHTILNLGFVDNIYDYMFASDLIFGKAGGLTITEILAVKRPCLIINKLPQQEIYNSNYIVNKGCAIITKKNEKTFIRKI